MNRIAFTTLLGLMLCVPAYAAQPLSEKELTALIDQLADVSEGDIGYSASMSGTKFLPLEASGNPGSMLLGQRAPQTSDTLKKLVEAGAAAAPLLVAHLNDARETKIKLEHQGFMGTMMFNDEYDFNVRVTPQAPPGINRDDWAGNDKHPSTHTITVGDLCFVALGQIVNRGFNATRYQPTAIIVINSPTYSEKLRDAITHEWTALTPQKHRAALLADLQKPDCEDRLTGAYMRLAYYYPDDPELEKAVLAKLARHTWDAIKVDDFARDRWYKAKPADRRKLYDDFIGEQGPAAKRGLLLQLLHDADMAKATREGRVAPPEKRFTTQPEELLAEFFPKQKKEEPDGGFDDDSVEVAAQARFIAELVHDPSVKIDRAVAAYLAAAGADDYLALACMQRLTGRGFDEAIEQQCKLRMPAASASDRKKYGEALDKLGQTPLHAEAERNYPGRIDQLLAKGIPLDAQARNGRTALHVAAANGHLESVRALLEHNAALNLRDNAGSTAVALAAHADHEAVVKALADAGCQIDDILAAAMTGNAAALQTLLNADPKLVDRSNDQQVKPLALAARSGFSAAVEILLKHHADPNSADTDGWTALHLAAVKGDTSSVQLLLAAKADPEATTGNEQYRPLHLAALKGHAGVVAALLAHKASPDAQDKYNQSTALHWAARNGHLNVIDTLLNGGAALNLKDSNDDTPLFVAVKEKQAATVKVLAKAGADPNQKGKDGARPLHEAADQGSLELASVLLEAGAEVNAANDAGDTPLHKAARKGHTEIARLLLAHGADVNRKGEAGLTALADAAYDGFKDTVLLLLENGADVTIRSKQNVTARYWPEQFGKKEIVEILEAHGLKE